MCDQSFLQKHSGSDPSALSSLGLNQDKQREKDPDLEQSDAKSLMRLDDSHYKDKLGTFVMTALSLTLLMSSFFVDGFSIDRYHLQAKPVSSEYTATLLLK